MIKVTVIVKRAGCMVLKRRIIYYVTRRGSVFGYKDITKEQRTEHVMIDRQRDASAERRKELKTYAKIAALLDMDFII